LSSHLESPNKVVRTAHIDRAGLWLLDSGIQEPTGGFARYYVAEKAENRPVSMEITGYAISTLTYLHLLRKDARYLDAAVRAASFLTQAAWDSGLRVFPFELAEDGSESERLVYFFDSGIIVRGLLSLWRITGQRELLDTATACGRSMASIFAAPGAEFHPILRLPDKLPLPRSDQWSRTTGCYQLKSALAWHDLHKITGDPVFLNWYEALLSDSLRTHESYLPGAKGDRIVMDRLHPYCYFLEAILPRTERPEVASALIFGIERVAHFVREIGPQFVRSDVYAQLLRLRLLADRAGVLRVNRQVAAAEAEILTSFQPHDGDRRIRGGFYFAKRGAQFELHANPVSTGFALQALAMWRQYLAGDLQFSTDALI
jgi:hypothetical protein